MKYFLHFFFLTLLYSCTKKETVLLWDQSFFRLGSQSSPRAADLNGDGILDIVIGAGYGEIDSTDHGVLAVDGHTGKLLWEQSSSAMMSGSASFLDINQDGTEDVVIGGRNRNLMALDGKTGNVIWSYTYQFDQDSILRHAKFNFYNCTFIPDQNEDGLEDLLTVNGGNWDIAPDSAKGREPGVLMVIDSKTGNVLAADTMPDGQESYMSPIAFLQPKTGEYQVIVGSGGETFSGNLYRVSLTEFIQIGLQNAQVIAREVEHGFIAPPSIVDLNQDGWQDIVVISHASTISAISGKDDQILWQQSFEGMESSNSLAIGQFTDDKIPDVLAYVCTGVWPNYTGTYQMMLDGRDGTIRWKDSLGCGGLSSPVVYDLNRDGVDEAILSINAFDCSRGYIPVLDTKPFVIENRLIAIDFAKQSTQIIDQTPDFKNVFSTPWIGDIDQDDYLDIVYPQYLNQDNILLFLGMRIKRISTHIPMRNNPIWGGYLGSKGDGIVPILH